MFQIKYLLVLGVLVFGLNAYIIEPGPLVPPTKGEIWPKPLKQLKTDSFKTINPNTFEFKVNHHNCDILQYALKRYKRLLHSMKHELLSAAAAIGKSKSINNPLYKGELGVLNVRLENECESYPHIDMDESYELNISNDTLSSQSIWGILRGLESFSQLIVGDVDVLRINITFIQDAPRFAYRGVLIDTARHFIEMPLLYKVLDGMAYNKLNVFHWHIVDDSSFPYESLIYPELSKKGAYHPKFVYTVSDQHRLVEYARLRGIRVLIELDTPGHTRSWGLSHPEVLTKCGGKYAGKLGPINPIIKASYQLIANLLKEMTQSFPDRYIHLGGDEVGFECWQSNADITKFMQKNNISSYEKLEELYIQRIVNIANKLNVTPMVWQEVFENGVKLNSGTIVHIWTGNSAGLLNNVTRTGLPAVLSSCWYLDHLNTGGDWRSFYDCDPHRFPGSKEQKKLVLGGEACMWAEVVDDSNFISRIFPRVSATAEKLWSEEKVKDVGDAAKRLEEHACRMKQRGINAQPPNGAGFCL